MGPVYIQEQGTFSLLLWKPRGKQSLDVVVIFEGSEEVYWVGRKLLKAPSDYSCLVAHILEDIRNEEEQSELYIATTWLLSQLLTDALYLFPAVVSSSLFALF